MSFVKNVGRKRLGRLPIVTGSSNTNHDRKRPCQIESRASNAVEKVPRLASPEISNVDLSFSASFACDLESDLDLMSALDNMEKAFKTTDDQTKSSSGASLITTSNSSVQQGNKGHTRSVAPTSKDKDVVANKTPKQLVSAHKENKKVSGSVKSQRNRSVTRKHDPLQDDSFWSSPVNMSTPQNPLHTKSRRTSLNSSKSKRSGSRVPSQASKGSKVTGKGGQLRDAQILKTPVQEVQSARITRSSAKRSNQREARPKPVLAGLDGSHETPVRGYKLKETTAVGLPSTNSAGKSNRSDFFKSLFMDNTSFDDISTLETESKKQAVAVRSKHNKNKDETTCSTRETNVKHLHEEVVETPENTRGSKSEETSSDSNTNKYVKSVNVEHSEDRDKVETRKDKEEARGNKEEARRDTVGARSVEIDIQEVDTGSTEQVEVGRTTVSDTLVGPEVNSQGDIGSIKIQPGATSDQLALSSWGLPEPVLKQYHKRGITHMFQWQADCLLQGNVLGGGNLVYSAPTSAGKTMVAELLVLKRVLETRKKAIIILPFVSVTREKMFYLQELYQDAGIRVSGFMGSYSPAGGFRNVDVAVCTIEKGNGIINRCLEENRLDQLGILVVDELHLIGDPHRGYLLELLLTKIAYMVKKSQRTACQDVAPISIQVVGMSATLPNLDLLAGWLDADLYRTDYRPVPLTECVKIGSALYDTNMALIRDIDTTYEVKGDADHVVPLCIETIRGGHSILIFCPTKNWCEKLSETVAREFYNLLRNPAVAVASTTGFSKASDLLVLPLDQSALRDVVEQLKRTPVGVDQVLGRTVPFGVAYHHAGLTFDERDIVEGAFRQGMLKVLIATSTLSSGVNLPARRVLVRTPVFHGHLIDFLTYKQMIGRAGRKGVDTAGESILLCKPSERTKAAKLLGGELPPVQSTLIRDTGEELSSSMKRAILEVVVSGVAMAPGDVAAYASCTLLAASLPTESGQTDQLIGQCIKFLQENEFVTAQAVTDDKGAQTERFVPTQLGAAVLASSLSPDEGLLVFSELQRARQCFVLENELHIIYQVTPIYAQGIGDAIDWYQYFCIWESLNAGMKKVSELAGVKESFLARAVQGRVPTKTDAQRQMLRIHKRFYTALALHDLVQEVALSEVAKKYNCNKGQLQSLQQSAATFAGMVTVFCARLGWSNLELILSQFQNRLTFGVQRELCDLVRVSSLNGLRARVMFNGGYQTVAGLASANPADIEALLKNSAPFQSKKRQDQETDWDMQARCKARCIFLTGRRGVTEYEAAQTIISEAKDIIQDELGGLGIQWGQAASGPPQLRTPVLTSPLARGGGRTKSVLGNRRSRSASKVGTTPDNAGSTRPSMPCVVSPPPADKHPAQSETSSAQNPEVQVDINNVSDKPAKVKNVTVENNRDMLHTNKEASVAVVTNIAKPSNSSNNSHSSVVNNSVEVAVIPVVQNWQQPVEPLSLISTDDVLSVKKTVKNDVSDEVCDNQHRSSSIAVVDTSRVKEKETSMIKYNHLKTDKPGSNSKQLNERKQPAVPEQSKKPAISIAVAQSRNKINNSRSSSANNISSASNIVINPGKTKTQQLALENTGIVQNSTATSSTSKENVDDGISFSDHMNDTFDIALRDSSVSSGNMKKENSDKCGRHIHEESDKSEDTKGNTETGKRNIRNSSQVTLITDYVQENPIHSSMEVDVGEKHSTMQNSLPMAEGSFIKSIAKTSLAPFTGSKSHIIEEDFADSFLIDTQVVSEMSNEQLIVSKDAQTICKIKDSEAANSNLLDIERSMHSPHKGSKLYAGNGYNLTGNEMVQRLSENKDDDVKESEDGKNLLVTSKEEQKPNESSDEILFSDESNTDLDNSCPRNTSAMVQKNEVSIDSDCNELDMNIGDRSDVDMFDRSEELVAASNYDHFGMTGESRTQVLADDSYQDLHIPYTSGQERCFEVADKEHPRVDHVRSVIGHNIGINSEGILGQFSSQRPKHVGDYSKLQEDLAVALDMGESFTNTFSEATAGTETVTAASDCDKPNTVCDDKEPDDNIGDSMTFSMMENALDEPNIVNTDVEKEKPVLKRTLQNDKPDTEKDEYKSKQSCDIADLLSVNTLVNNDNEIKVVQNLGKRKQQNDIPVSKHRLDTNVFHVDPISTSVLNCFNDDTFVTPTKAPNKRLRETPVARKQKIQKTEDIRDGNADEMKLRSRKRTCSVEIHVDGVTEERLDTSTGSDYVPPTPPGDDSMIGSTQEQHDTPKRTPFCSMKSSAAFSPRLKAAASARQCKQKLNEVEDTKHDANHMENGIRKSRSKDRRKKSNEEENRTTPDHSTRSKTSKKKPGQVVDSEEKLEFNDVETPEQDVVETLDDDVEEGEVDDKLSPSFIDPDESGLPLTQASFTIVDVCGDKRLFKTFILEWRTKTRYALSLACEKKQRVTTGGIGANFRKGGGGRTKSVLGNRRSRSASKVGTTPDNAGSTRPSMPCVVSPPPADKHPAQSETSSAQNPEVQVDINNVSDKPAKVKNVTVENNRDMLHTNKEASVAVVTNIAKPSNSSNNSHSSVVNNSVEVAVIPVVQNWQQPVEPLSLISTDDVLSVKKTVKNDVSDEVCDNQHRSSSIAVVDTSRVKEKETSMIKYNHLKTDKPGSNSKQLNERKQPAVPEQSKKPAISIAVAQSRNKINNSRSSSANNISSASNIVINPGKTKTQQLALENTGIVQNSTATSSTSKENVDDGISFSDHMNDTFDIALRDSSVSSGNMKKENSDKCGRHIHEESDKSEDTKGNTETGKRNIRNSSQVTLITDYVQENPIHSSMEVDVGEKHSTMQNSLPMAEGSFIKSIAKTSLAPFTGSKSHIIEEDFADSFLIDTQVVSEMSNEQLIVSKDAQTICKIKDSEAANSNLLDIERSMHSPHKGSKLYAGNGYNLTGNEMVQRLSENKDDDVKESEDGKNLLVTSKEEQKPNESSDEILFSDESNTDLDNSCPRNTSAMVQKNEVSIDSDCNELDMNIGDRSDVDMFDRSEELVAASNYDHFGMTGESRTQVLADDSYQDLHIPYTSGQERCFEVADKEHPRVDHVRSVIGHNIGINSEGILGQFSSQRPKHVGDYSKLQEDLAVALDMGESFTNTFSEATAGTETVTAASDCDKPNTVCDDKEPDDNIGDSMTFSMMENALDEPNIVNTDVEKEKPVLKRTLQNDKPDTEKDEYKSKQSCDIADLLSVNTLVNNDNEIKVVQNLGKRKQQNDIPVSKHRLDTNVFHVDPISTSVLNCFNDDTFVTPTKAPNKRLRETPVARKQKIQKTEDIRDGNADEMKLRSRKRTCSVEIHVDGVTEERLDTSTGSDYVPPTPPGDDSMIGSTQEQHDTPKRTPFCSMKSSAAFSPRLKAAASARQCKQKLNEVEDTKHDANHMENGIRKSRSKDRRKKSNEEENRTTPDHSTRSKTSKKKPGQVVDSEEKLEFNDVETPEQDVVETLDDDVEEGEVDDKLSPSFIDPDESGLPLTQASFTIVDVCGDKRLFKTFILEWRTKTRYALSLACEKKQRVTTGGIGANFRKDYSPSKVAADVGGIPLDSEGHVIVGVAVSWDNRDAYYVSFTHDDPQGDPDDSLSPPSSDPDISITIRLKAVKSVLQQAAYKGDAVTMVMFDVKAHYRAMVEGCGFVPRGQFEDPRIACWMLDPGAKEKTLHRMVTNLLPTEVHMLHGIGGGIGLSSLGMSPANPGSGRYRATTEVVLVRHLGEYFRRCLEKEELYSVFTDVEMPSAVTLCRMELNGFGFSMEESESQKGIMIAKLSALEEQAYTLAGHPFSLSATEDVAQVLFVELLLPPSGDQSSCPVTRSLAPGTRGGARKGRQKTPYSTSKDILEKLRKLHPLPGVILEWRRITNALTKTVFPLQKEKVLCDRLSMYRIYSDCQLHTATGRISLSEPNLQNVPKDFEITMPDLIGESPPPNSTYANSRRSMGGSSKLRQMIGPRQVAMVTDDNNGNKFSVSMRHAFIPFSGGVLVAADYSQLELRMIAYLSDDQKLITVLNEEGDVFKLITAQWKNIKPHEVTPEQRAQAKQVCYGMIYGIGPKALGEQLEVEENDAAVFIETFKAKYPTMRSYLRKTVELCRVNGYVQTMLGRKRYLPQIIGTNPHSRAQAERQAVNTTVQGSAADLVKMATNKIDQRLAERFPMTAFTHRQKLNSKVVSSLSRPPQGAFLVLQLHDELIYEVSAAQLMDVARIMKDAMETAVKLPVKMPVKLKAGPSWGTMQDMAL